MARARRLVDIGANLTDSMFRGVYRGKNVHQDDLVSVLERASEAGVFRIMVTGGSLVESQAALALAQQHDSLFSTVGVHPTRCGEFLESDSPEYHLEQLLNVARLGIECGKVVAIGECGLDYDRLEFCDKDTQLRFFEAQFALAEQTGLPMFFHCRNAARDFVDVVSRNRHKIQTGVVHSFDGSEEEAKMMLDLDLYIGINGCSLKTSENLQVVASLPNDRIMIETDSPWCDIRNSHAGSQYVKTQWRAVKKEKFELGLCVKSRNEPCHLVQVLEVVSAVRGQNEDDVERYTTENAMNVFFSRFASPLMTS